MKVILLVDQVEDPVSRENFQKLQDALGKENLLVGGFKFFELTFTKAETNKKIPHRLGYQPKDVIQTSVIGAGAITWNYSLFTKDNLDVTTTAACVVRAFIGSYRATGA